jgi:Domain of unknown function (DUF1883)
VKFLRSEVIIDEGDSIRVSLHGTEATVMIMDDSNFRRYRDGSRFEFAGGCHRQSPAIIRPPRGGHWNVIVDFGVCTENVEAVVSVIR